MLKTIADFTIEEKESASVDNLKSAQITATNEDFGFRCFRIGDVSKVYLNQ